MTEDLLRYYNTLHSREAYGDTSVKNLPYIAGLVAALKPETIVDYGCGQSALHKHLVRITGAKVTRYDPAIPELSVSPAGRYDLLVNIDVLEHVPEDELAPLIQHMQSLAVKAIIVIDTGPAVQFLPDGRNAHLTEKPAEWWAEQLRPFYPYLRPIRVRSKRRAAFVTWPQPYRPFKDKLYFLREEVRYKLGRLFSTFRS